MITDKIIELKLTIEGRRFIWNKQFITGAELRELGDIPQDKELYLSLRDPWDDELIDDDSTVDLARPGIEHFYLRHELKLTINSKRFSWKSQYITGEQLRKLGMIDDDETLFLDNKGEFEDPVIEDNERINLARPGVEHFYSKNVSVKVILIINGREKEWDKRKISFTEVIILTFGSISDNPNICYTATYKKGPRQNPEGSMVKGDVVFVKDKMIFNVSFTDKS